MLYTSAEANKLLKRIESRISDLKDKEEKVKILYIKFLK